MELLAVIAGAAALALSAEAFILGREGIPRLMREMYLTGIPFLLLGMLLGSHGIGILDQEMVMRLDPLVLFGLGSIGFLYGLHLERRRMRHFSWRIYSLTMTESIIPMVAVFLATWWALDRVGQTELAPLIGAVVMAAACSGTSPGALFHMGMEKRLAGIPYQVTRFISTLDDLPGLFALGFLFAFFSRGLVPLDPLYGAFSVLLSVGVGGAVGVLLIGLFGLRLDEQEGGLAVLGVIALSSAIASIVGLCPLFVNLVAGLTVANFSMNKERVYESLAKREHTVYLLFLVLLGSRLVFHLDVLWVAALCLAVRALFKMIGWEVGTLWMGKVGRNHLRGMGAALLPQGGMALAMTASYYRNDPIHAEIVMTAIILCVVINGLVGPELSLRILSRAES